LLELETRAMKKIKIILNYLLCLLILASSHNIHAEPYNLAIKKLDKQFDRKYWGYENPVTSTEKQFTYYVPLHKSRIISLNGKVKKISKGNPKIANILLFPPNQLFLQGLKLGTTNTMVWDARNKINHIINIEVTHDLESLKAKLYELLPSEEIHVRSVQKNIVLSGEVSGLDVMQAAIDIAQSFLGSSSSKELKGGAQGHQNQSESSGNKNEEKSKGDVPHIINLMSVGGAQQVMLEVTIAEIDRKIFRGLDINFNTLRPSSQIAFGALNGGGSFSPIRSLAPNSSLPFEQLDSIFPADTLSNTGGIAGPLRQLFLPNSHSVDAAGVFLSAVSGSFIFNLTIDAAKNQQLAKILAEPVLTTLSGQEAKFISGGEFPIPVASGRDDAITVVFKEFGISMKFIPVVLDSGRINLNMNVGVSELSEDAAVFADTGLTSTRFSIPSLTKREASTTLELGDGQTMSIAGLISEKIRSNVDKFPGLGDIPVLGTLFRSESFLKDRTELIFFVTPHLAKPILAEDIKLPTDSFVEPDDMDFYILGRLDSRHAKSILEDNTFNLNDSKGGLEGQFGHQLIEEGGKL